jgi:hypothetical protein
MLKLKLALSALLVLGSLVAAAPAHAINCNAVSILCHWDETYNGNTQCTEVTMSGGGSSCFQWTNGKGTTFYYYCGGQGSLGSTPGGC